MKEFISLSEMQTIVDAIPNAIFVKNRAHRIVLANTSACAFLGRSRETLLSQPDTDLFPADEVEVFHRADDRVFESGEESEDEEQVTDASGRTRFVLTRKRIARLDGADYLVASVTDISATREAEARNRYLAFHDALTGLPNRALLQQRIEQALQRRTHGCALLYIDLDRFKEVNDRYGHPAGDELIQEFAKRLSGIVRAADTVARLGGDEFAVLLSDTSKDPKAEEVCRRGLVAAARRFDLAVGPVQVGASIGVVVTGLEHINQTELQRRSDIALYQAKNDGRGCFRVFTQFLDDSATERHELQVDLRRALETEAGLELHYQPIVGVLSGKVEGYEALVRWQHPTRGLIMPGEFIPVAEASGLIVELDEWVLGRACADACTWDPSLWVAVNVSPIQFAFDNLAERIEQIVTGAGLDPARLELEITEGVLIQDPKLALVLLNRIRAFGVRVALDDFGIGYSSLSYFQSFPFDKIKIDRSFVTSMTRSSQARSIVQAVMALARGLGLQTVAEGIETYEQLAALTAEGCTQVQGYLFGRPAPMSADMMHAEHEQLEPDRGHRA